MSTHDLAISIRGLSKAYTLGGAASRRQTFGEAIVERIKRPLRRRSATTFWALKDVSLDIKKGEVVGIIGRNGAGKSTLLKVLSRITEPTAGNIKLYGRIGSLLEVGTGFHPELTGRENIYLNGTILGMSRAEIKKQFEAIVDFAETEKFLDTPVKRYSSGMYVRLAFAVAAHLNPDILVVDEVLAVGDSEFQKKCLGKMQDVARGGRTVLFVSHNMQAVRNLCSKTVLLQAGRLLRNSDTDSCLAEFAAGTHGMAAFWEAERLRTPLAINRVSVVLRGEQPAHWLDVQVDVASSGPHRAAFIAIDICDALGTAIMQAIPTLSPFISDSRAAHHLELSIELPPLIPGQYGLGVWIGPHNTETYDEVRQCVTFEIGASPTPGRTVPHTPDHGYIVPPATLRSNTGLLSGRDASAGRHPLSVHGVREGN